MDRVHFVEAPNNFYLGAQVNPDTHEIINSLPVYYDARDLTTHGVILGMTGSGKTGLGITILEEAALDGIPCLILDPKGDITNLLLAFPELAPEYFQPWVNPEDALRADHTLEEHAEDVARRWREGLERWGITNDRVQQFRKAARYSIYTPGSEAGLPVSILRSFAAPSVGWAGNEEMLRERIEGLVSALLALIGVNAKPVEDREHILLSNIFETNWRQGADLSMAKLILQVQRPPFDKLGVLDVESVFPEKDRIKLAQSLNNIMAAPSFQSWIKGEPIDIPSMLFTPEGYPRVTIFYTAHLNDAERQFIHTLLLGEIHSWMRSLSGSTSLRALIYIDEVFGMFPPHPYNPPTKEPLLRLLKQARAFGVGVLVSTQNPKDIDYKGLSNAGTWWIGKLQTENDKERVLEGLDSARDATSALDIKTVDSLLSRLGPREFILHNVHEPNTPILMHTRWAMSYLRGPLTRPQISKLMANQRPATGYGAAAEPHHRPATQGTMPQQFGAALAAMPSSRPGQPPAQAAASVQVTPPEPAPAAITEDRPPAGFSAMPPSLGTTVRQYYFPVEYNVEQALYHARRAPQPGLEGQLLYQPCLLAQTMVRFTHRPTDTAETYTYAFVVPDVPHLPHLNWMEFVSNPFDPSALETAPRGRGFYADLPPQMNQASAFTALEQNLIDWIYQNAALYVYHNPVLNVYSGIDEPRKDFIARVQAIARERRDEELDKVASRYDAQLAKLEERIQRKSMRLDAEREELSARKREELLSAGESLWQLMRGRAYYTLSRTSRMRRYTSSSEDQLGILERDLNELVRQLDQTEAEMEDALRAVQEKWSNAVREVREVRITPYKKDITMMLFGLGWVPYWYVTINGVPAALPASSSTITEAQTVRV